MKRGLLEMESEMNELQRMITRTETEIKAVEGEAKEKLGELENVLKRGKLNQTVLMCAN